jgi:AmiR/NasT family two-component response regulator
VQVGVTAALSELASSRAVIDQAKGVLIAAYGISADQAFDRLVRRSQEANVKLRHIANQFLAAMSGKLGVKPETDILRTAIPQAGTRR